MKHATKHATMLLVTAAVLLLAGCAEESVVSPDLAPGERVAAAQKLGRVDGAVTVPFKADFFTESQDVPPGFRESCGDRPFPPFDQVIQAGYGEATHLGRFTAYMTFCVDISDFLDDGMLTEGESVPYDNGVGTFTAANGDELWFTMSGEVLPSDEPGYDKEFFDAFEFVGGTGRFEGASGGGVMDSKGAGLHNDHYWSGELTVPRGK